jgi:hypothetical protein
MNDRILVQQHNPRTGKTEYMVKYLDEPPRTRRARGRRADRKTTGNSPQSKSRPDPSSAAMVALSAEMQSMSIPEVERRRRRALSGLRSARGADRRRLSNELLLADARLGKEGEPAFEDRLELAREALGREPSSEDRYIKQQAAEVRASIEGASPDPGFDSRVAAARAALSPGPDSGVAARARAVRESMKRARRSY